MFSVRLNSHARRSQKHRAERDKSSNCPNGRLDISTFTQLSIWNRRASRWRIATPLTPGTWRFSWPTPSACARLSTCSSARSRSAASSAAIGPAPSAPTKARATVRSARRYRYPSRHSRIQRSSSSPARIRPVPRAQWRRCQLTAALVFHLPVGCQLRQPLCSSEGAPVRVRVIPRRLTSRCSLRWTRLTSWPRSGDETARPHGPLKAASPQRLGLPSSCFVRLRLAPEIFCRLSLTARFQPGGPGSSCRRYWAATPRKWWSSVKPAQVQDMTSSARPL